MRALLLATVLLLALACDDETLGNGFTLHEVRTFSDGKVYTYTTAEDIDMDSRVLQINKKLMIVKAIYKGLNPDGFKRTFVEVMKPEDVQKGAKK